MLKTIQLLVSKNRLNRARKDRSKSILHKIISKIANQEEENKALFTIVAWYFKGVLLIISDPKIARQRNGGTWFLCVKFLYCCTRQNDFDKRQGSNTALRVPVSQCIDGPLVLAPKYFTLSVKRVFESLVPKLQQKSIHRNSNQFSSQAIIENNIISVFLFAKRCNQCNSSCYRTNLVMEYGMRVTGVLKIPNSIPSSALV